MCWKNVWNAYIDRDLVCVVCFKGKKKNPEHEHEQAESLGLTVVMMNRKRRTHEEQGIVPQKRAKGAGNPVSALDFFCSLARLIAHSKDLW